MHPRQAVGDKGISHGRTHLGGEPHVPRVLVQLGGEGGLGHLEEPGASAAASTSGWAIWKSSATTVLVGTEMASTAPLRS